MKPQILVVEDSPLSREMLSDWLESHDFAVNSVSSLSEAFAALEKYQPEAILLDVQLGPDDGLSLATWLRHDKTRQHIPVIAVTAHAMITEQERILRAGCNAYISKPIEFELLREQLDRWLTVAAIMNRAPDLTAT